MREREREKVCNELFVMFVPSKKHIKPFELPAGRLHYNARTFLHFSFHRNGHFSAPFSPSLRRFFSAVIFSFRFSAFSLIFSLQLRLFHRSVCAIFSWFYLLALAVTLLPSLCATFKNVIFCIFQFILHFLHLFHMPNENANEQLTSQIASTFFSFIKATFC